MAAKVVHTIREDKQGLQKQLGCMNGIFQLFDRRYLLGQHRYGRSRNRLTAGEGEKDFKNRAGVESSRNSFSSSCSSTTFSSSFNGSKRVQTEWQLPSEPTSPNLHKKEPDWSLRPPDIRDVVRESMTKAIRVTKNERVSPVMKHIDSPRPFVHQKPIQDDRKDQNLAKIGKISPTVKEVKEISRFSCDERESQYSLKSTFKVKEPPRLSLDSKHNANPNSMNDSRSEPGSNKRPSSGVIARLMGLDSLTDSICEDETLKIQPAFSDQRVSSSPRVPAKMKPALQQQRECDRPFKKPSVYGEMEKMLDELKFNTSGKDLRALKQILEAIQMTKTGLNKEGQSLELRKPDQPCSPTVKGASSPKRSELLNRAMKPEKMAREPKMITKHHDVNSTARKHVNNQALKNTKATGKMPSPKLQKTKNGVNKQCSNGPSSNSSRIKKQLNPKIKHTKIKPINPMQNNEPFMSNKEDDDTVSFKSKVNPNLASQRRLEVPTNDQPKENHMNNFAETLMEDKPIVELAKLSVEQPSPVSVLDAFYAEEIPSPIKNKPNAFNNDENLHDDQTGRNREGIYNLVNDTDTDHSPMSNYVKLENTDCPVQQTELLNSIDEMLASSYESKNEDHRYIREILLASGFVQDLDSAIRIVQLHPTSSLIKPELFQILENPNVKDDEKNTGSKSNDKIRRKLIFDSVNEILFHKLVTSNEKICGRLMNGEKLLTELCSEIDVLQSCSKRCLYDEDDDEVINLVSVDVNKKSEDWDKCCYEVPGVVLDIERLIFKDLIDEVVNAEAVSLQHPSKRHCKQLLFL
ncbi:hypothetical protein SSX86_014500 [Deinandra increscens subsp. villosa]|uniref:DUF4378 domain-containing protein n=1 Tax=Deinandra increscens subsp. villosa TaxID=3103831 RepID=A0AAP0D6M0_9ASTR